MQMLYNDIYNYDKRMAVATSFDEIECCPSCKHAIKPIKLYGQFVKDNNEKLKLSVTYYCGHCFDSFITQYSDCKKER